jgi:hypothetical protein
VISSRAETGVSKVDKLKEHEEFRMNRLFSLPVSLLVVVALLLATGCASPAPSPPRTDTASVPATSPSGSAPAPVGKSVLSDDQRARELLDRAVVAMGGAAVVDGVKTLVLTGKMQQRSAVGDYEATVTTTFLYPNKVRRDVVLPTGDAISSIFTPERAWMEGALGNVDLPEEEKQKLEVAAMRNPVSILKSRNHTLFRVSQGNSAGVSEVRRDVLVIWFAGQTTEAVLDGEHRIVEFSWEAPISSPEAKKERIRVRYSDFQLVEGLVYPFSSEAFSGEEKVSSFRLDSLRVNQPVPPALFAPPSPAPTATPGARKE